MLAIAVTYKAKPGKREEALRTALKDLLEAPPAIRVYEVSAFKNGL